jgi:DNA anti-recombination protein RmuC
MNKPNGSHLHLMAKAETIKQADLAKKLRRVQDEVNSITAQAGSIDRMLDEQGEHLRRSQTSAQLANTLRLGQQLEGFRTTLSMKIAQSERQLQQAQTALAQSGHKLDMLTEKAKTLDAQQKSE